MKLPTNRKQQQMIIGTLKALKAKRMAELDYKTASEIDKEIFKIKAIIFK
jgi:hypothetical protein